MLKITFRKIIALNDVLHVPNIQTNSVFVRLLGKVGVKVSFESYKVIMTKNNIFVGKGYYKNGFFLLIFFEIINGKVSSFAYLIDLYNLWLSRLIHVNIF